MPLMSVKITQLVTKQNPAQLPLKTHITENTDTVLPLLKYRVRHPEGRNHKPSSPQNTFKHFKEKLP